MKTLQEQVKDPIERLFSKIRLNESTNCWEWVACLNRGYSRYLLNGKVQFGHRIILNLIGIKTPNGMRVDHVCMNKKCVNPEHLRVVNTSISNLENSNCASAVNARKTHCKFGHEYTVTKINCKSGFQRVCKTCRKEYDRKRRGGTGNGL